MYSFRITESQTLEWNVRKSTRCPLVLSSLGPLLLIQCLLEFVFLYFFLLLLLIVYRYVLSFFPSYHWMHLHNLIWYILWRSILRWSYNISSANCIYDQQKILQQSCITSYTLIHSFDRSKFILTFNNYLRDLEQLVNRWFVTIIIWISRPIILKKLEK